MDPHATEAERLAKALIRAEKAHRRMAKAATPQNFLHMSALSAQIEQAMWAIDAPEMKDRVA